MKLPISHGANDVAMISEENTGRGPFVLKASQAAMSADYTFD